MAARYVYSGAAGTGTGADWTNAHTTLAAAITASSGGDTFYVAHDHAESQASALTLTFKAAYPTADTVLCVNRAGSVPPVAADITTGATVTTTGANGISLGGCCYGEGLTFNVGTGSSAASITFNNSSNQRQRFKNSAFNLVTTSSSSRINACPGAGNITEWDGCTVSFGATGQGISVAGLFSWVNKPGGVGVTGATIPTNLFLGTSGNQVSCVVSGVDLSASGSGKTLVAGASSFTQYKFVNCKLGASVTVAGTPDTNGFVDIIGCHSSGNVRRDERYRYGGTLTTETTIKRTAGASDGVTAYSWKVVTTANAKRTFPFETFEGALWNSSTGSSKTLTVHVVTDNVTLTDAEIWLEVEYLGSSGSPVTTLITDANATVLTTAANQTSDSSEAWTTTGLTTPVKQKLEVTFTPQMAGPIRWRVKVAKASTTVYVCPKADLS